MKNNEQNSITKRIRKILSSIVIFLSLFTIGVIIYKKVSEQTNYADNTQETKEELSNELPICENGTIEKNVSNENIDYQPDELMGSIYIPKFELVIPLYMENESDDSNWALELGVAMDSSSSYPYGNTSTVIYGHRHYDFQNLKNIEIGDDILLSIGENIYLYEVTSTEVVNESDVDEVFTDKNELVLYTCYPFYWGASTDERFVVHASPVNSIEC